MNTDVEVSEHSERLAPVFEDAGTGRPWLVAGYSGSNDPVFDHLANVDVFDYQLYWAGYKNAPPPAHVRDRLIKEGKYAFYLPGHDADSLFVTLAQKLGCFPPELFSRPFSFLDDQIADIAEYPIPDQDDELDIPGDTRRRIRAAIDRYERGVEDAETGLADVSRLARASRALMAGNYDDVIKAYVSASDDQKTELADVAASAYLFRATTLAQQARNEGNEGDRLFKRSYEEYARAVEIKPDKHEAFNNWGNTLLSQARRKERAEGDLLFAESYEKYARAVEIKPDYHEAFYNWGNALSYQARRKEGAEGDRLFEESYEKYARALEIKPDYHEAFESWSATLVNHGVREEGEEAVLLLEQATDRALSAEQLMAGSGAYNLACISARLGKVDEAKMWLHQSLETGFLPSRNHLSEDDDLDAVREEPWFAEILAGSETGPA